MRVGDAVQVILHAGMHKTGTSALQNSLYAHRDALLKAGILYPTTGLHFGSPQAGHRHLGLQRSLEQEGPQGFVMRRLRREIEDSSCHTVILSHEGFFTPAIDAEQLHEALAGFDTTVLIFLRDPVDYVESKYREWVRLLGYTGEIEQFLSEQWPVLDVLGRASEWEKHFGYDHMVIRSYDSLQSPRDILDQVITLTQASGVALQPHPDSNPGPSNEYTLAKLVANRLRLAGRPVDSKHLPSMEPAYASNGGRLLSAKAVEEIQKRAGPGFADLLKRYGQNPDLVSRWAARPRDDAFFDSAVRSSVAGQIEAAAEAAATASRQEADKREQARARARRTKRALRSALADLEYWKDKASELEGRLQEARKRLAKARDTETALGNALAELETANANVTRLNEQLDDTKRRLAKQRRARLALRARLEEFKERLRIIKDERDYLQHRLDLLKAWRPRNWVEYAAIVKRRLERPMRQNQ